MCQLRFSYDKVTGLFQNGKTEKGRANKCECAGDARVSHKVCSSQGLEKVSSVCWLAPLKPTSARHPPTATAQALLLKSPEMLRA